MNYLTGLWPETSTQTAGQRTREHTDKCYCSFCWAMRSTLKLLCVIALFAIHASVLAIEDTGYQGYYNFLRNNNYPPRFSNPVYDNYAFGITHDADHWYISQRSVLWRIPIATDLNTIPDYTTDPLIHPEIEYAKIGIGYSKLSSYSALTSENYNRFSDLAYYNYNGWPYLFTTVWSEMDETSHQDNNKRALAVFNAVTLELVDHLEFQAPNCPLGAQAFGPDGILYGMNPSQGRISGCIDQINRYQINWVELTTDLNLILTPLQPIPLAENTWPYYWGGFDAYLLSREQWISMGCDVSPDGSLLYIAEAFAGVEVFDLATGDLVKQSADGLGYFNVDIDTDADKFAAGLTIWDLDEDTRAPNIQGQHHVLMRDHDTFSHDQVAIQHYSNKLWIDPTYVGEEWGTPDQPISDLPAAAYWAWDRSVLMIPGGNYPDPVTFDNRMLFYPITQFFGPVIIGE